MLASVKSIVSFADTCAVSATPPPGAIGDVEGELVAGGKAQGEGKCSVLLPQAEGTQRHVQLLITPRDAGDHLDPELLGAVQPDRMSPAAGKLERQKTPRGEPRIVVAGDRRVQLDWRSVVDLAGAEAEHVEAHQKLAVGCLAVVVLDNREDLALEPPRITVDVRIVVALVQLERGNDQHPEETHRCMRGGGRLHERVTVEDRLRRAGTGAWPRARQLVENRLQRVHGQLALSRLQRQQRAQSRRREDRGARAGVALRLQQVHPAGIDQRRVYSVGVLRDEQATRVAESIDGEIEFDRTRRVIRVTAVVSRQRRSGVNEVEAPVADAAIARAALFWRRTPPARRRRMIVSAVGGLP
jgi:hypothetical protein